MASKRLHNDLSALINKYKQWQSDGDGMNMSGKDLDEVLHHYEWCRVKCSTFVGRGELVDECIDAIYSQSHNYLTDQLREALENNLYLQSIGYDTSPNKSTSKRLSRIDLCLVGRSGTVINTPINKVMLLYPM
jgi:hypothetical protein